MKIAKLTASEVILYSMDLKNDSDDFEFLEALINFIEYNGTNIDKRLNVIFERDAKIILHCLNRYIISELENKKFNLRLFNAIIKYTPSNFSKDYSKMYNKILKELYIKNILN